MLKWLMLIVYIFSLIIVFKSMLYWFRRLFPIFQKKAARIVLLAVYLVFASTIFFGSFLPDSTIQAFIHKIGNYWLGLFIYLLFFTVIADLLILLLKKIHKKDSSFIQKPALAVIYAFVWVLSLGLEVYGTIHAYQLEQASYTVTINKKVDGIEELNIVLVADMHLGYNVGCKEMQNMADRINALNPDLVFYAGDEFDNDFDALDDPDELARILSTIKAKYGCYAIFGNHDVVETLVGGFPITSDPYSLRDPRMQPFLESAGITVLNDEVTTIVDGKINLIGRYDIERVGTGTKERASIEELVAKCDPDKPIFCMDHEPEGLDEIASAGVDLLFSGHTHAGQFFPLTIVQPFRWKNYWGLKTFGNMYSLVTSGVGVYGPALRVGTNSEIVQLTVKFAG